MQNLPSLHIQSNMLFPQIITELSHLKHDQCDIIINNNIFITFHTLFEFIDMQY